MFCPRAPSRYCTSLTKLADALRAKIKKNEGCTSNGGVTTGGTEFRSLAGSVAYVKTATPALHQYGGNMGNTLMRAVSSSSCKKKKKPYRSLDLNSEFRLHALT